MRKAALIFAALPLLGLTACATGTPTHSLDELARLDASCAKRGGHIESNFRRLPSAYEVLNKVCKIDDPTKASPPREEKAG